MAIRNEETGTGELIQDGVYLWASLLSDPETTDLAQPVRQGLDPLKKADQTTRDADETEIEKGALLQRAEYVHDSLHRDCELDVLKAVKKNRKADGYRAVYPKGLSGLISLSGRAQEQAVGNMLKELAVHHPDLAKKYSKDLAALAQKASHAEQEWEKAANQAAYAFQTERLARSGLVRIMQRTEGGLLALFPGDRTRVRSYFRDHRRRHSEPSDPTPNAE